MSKMKAEFEYSYYIVAIIDLLGVSESLEKIGGFPTNDSEKSTFISTLRPSFGRVNNFREHIIRIKDSFTGRPLGGRRPRPLSPEEEKIYLKYSNPKVETEFFSDTAILKINLKENDNYSPITSAWNLFIQLELLMISCLSGNWPIRGAVEVGICAELDPHGLFGQAIARAHYLESRIAEYPRIVIGGHFLEFLNSHNHIMEATGIPEAEKRLMLSFSKLIQEFLIEDDDGQIILDYLVATRYGKTANPTFEEIAKKISINIQKEIECFRKQGNTKLFNRYRKLKNFFQRKNCWAP